MAVSHPPCAGTLPDDANASPGTQALLARARALRRDALAGRVQPLLRGKNYGLVCETDDGPDAQRFRRAAGELGAHVVHVRPIISERSSGAEVRQAAQLLARLYDAVECQGVAAALVQRVAADAAVPIYDGLACASHPTARLADLLDQDGTRPDDNRRFILQAVLLDAVV